MAYPLGARTCAPGPSATMPRDAILSNSMFPPTTMVPAVCIEMPSWPLDFNLNPLIVTVPGRTPTSLTKQLDEELMIQLPGVVVLPVMVSVPPPVHGLMVFFVGEYVPSFTRMVLFPPAKSSTDATV